MSPPWCPWFTSLLDDATIPSPWPLAVTHLPVKKETSRPADSDAIGSRLRNWCPIRSQRSRDEHVTAICGGLRMFPMAPRAVTSQCLLVIDGGGYDAEAQAGSAGRHRDESVRLQGTDPACRAGSASRGEWARAVGVRAKRPAVGRRAAAAWATARRQRPAAGATAMPEARGRQIASIAGASSRTRTSRSAPVVSLD